MNRPKACLSLAFFLLLFLQPVSFAEFSMKSLTVQVNVNLDGSANVEEQLYVVMEGSQSLALPLSRHPLRLPTMPQIERYALGLVLSMSRRDRPFLTFTIHHLIIR